MSKLIRNFSIIAHIDHGKSTIADRIIELCHAVESREMKTQLLDSMDLERERGITIKLNTIRLNYHSKDGNDYVLNLIDTPGHVDFTYEVSRSLAACDGAVLVIDAAQGVQAQTLANLYLAIENNLDLFPTLNKIDLPTADVERVKKQLEKIGVSTEDIPLVSGKTGFGIDNLVEKIISFLPSPSGNDDNPLQALIFDSYYDAYLGAISYVCIKNGSVKAGDKIYFMNTNTYFEVVEVGVFTPKKVAVASLNTGDVGYIAAGIKTVRDISVGDTITLANNKAKKPLAGYKKLKPMVFSGVYCVDSERYDELKDALERLYLNDSSLVYEPESSSALGSGFRVGFLGLLHMDIIQERLEREYGLNLIATAPSVVYKVYLRDESIIEIDNPARLPDPTKVERIEEPYALTTILTPQEYIGGIMELCKFKRGVFHNMQLVDDNRMSIDFYLPLAEIMYNFFDKIKSISSGYASIDYELADYRTSNLVKLDVLLNGDVVDSLSVIVHKDFAYSRGSDLVDKIKEVIPRHQFEIPVQAAIGGKVIARATVKALRKDVLAKCYGGDISRKKKLLEKQKEGKKRMKAIGSVEVPQDAFLAILKVG